MSARLVHVGFILSLTAAIAACGRDGAVSAPPAGAAEIKFVHASAAVGPVDVYVAGSKVISGVPFGHSSAKAQVPAGLQRVTLRSGATFVDDVEADIAPQSVTAIILTADTAEATPILPDTGHVATNNRANIRIVNVAGSNTSSPTLLDVLIRAPGLPSDSVPKLSMDTRVSSHGPLMYFDPGTFRFRFVPQGGTTVLAEVTFDVAAGEKRSVVLERDANGQYQAHVVIEP